MNIEIKYNTIFIYDTYIKLARLLECWKTKLKNWHAKIKH